jgi:hypothetical protein
MTQFTCKGVKQINNRISFKHLYHSYLSAFFISARVPNGEFLSKACPDHNFYVFPDKSIIFAYLLTLPLFAGVSHVRALFPAWTGSHAREILISCTHLFLPPTTKLIEIRSFPRHQRLSDSCLHNGL